MRALLWAHTGPIASAQDVASDRGLTNAGSQAIDFLLKLQHRPLFLPGMLLWRFMLAGWARAQEQHDCAEFLYHIVPKPCPKALEGDWSARRQEHARPARVSRQFPLRCLPGGAPRPGPHSPIQWHTQPSVHALRHPPYLLILQFPRYSYGPERASKNHANIIWPRILNMPLFTAEGLESCNITYKVEAAILHRGQCITEGHYTTLLHDEGETLLCDDGVAPRPVPLHSPLRAGLCYQSREVYLLICRRGEAPRC